MQVIDMKMNDVELVRALKNTFQHDEMMRHLVLTMLVQTQRPSGTQPPAALSSPNLRSQRASLRGPVAPVPP